MAGYFTGGCHLNPGEDDDVLIHSVNIDTPDVFGHVMLHSQSRVLTLQVDGDELDAVLWGLAKYDKSQHLGEVNNMREIARLNIQASLPSPVKRNTERF